ncbi:MAG: cyclic nucleotide-binding domain-containing protein [Planctomycetaceae bacterium]|nr:cyclic nucleotide-binding domain-containing protein [Planctomycetaceae bacterium]
MSSVGSDSASTIAPEDLLQCSVFSGIQLADAKMILAAVRIMHFEPQTVILEEGKSAQALWLILSGECSVLRTSDCGKGQLLATIGQKDVFGEMSFICSRPHSATIQANTAVTALVYTREDFLILAGSHPTAAFVISSNIAAVLADRLLRMDNWMCELVNRPEARHHRDEWQAFRSTVYNNWNL